MIYLDNNATTKPCAEAVEAVERALTEAWANPSSVHRAGQAARREIDLARAQVAALLGGVPVRTITFTSGATEAIDLAIRGVVGAMPVGKRTIITSAIEHEAVRELCSTLAQDVPSVQVKLLPVSREGMVNANSLDDMIDDTVAIVSLQWVNNETGAIQPVAEIGRLCREKNVLFHCDAAQWVGKMPMPEEMPCDLLSCSAHKFHGPKGIGALYVRSGVGIRPQTQGVQEMGRRGGTENVPGICGMGAAAREAMAWLEDESKRTQIAVLRDRFERGVLTRVENAVVIGPIEAPSPQPPPTGRGGQDSPSPDPDKSGPPSPQGRGSKTCRDGRLWNTANIAFPHLEAEALLMLLSESGVAASAGAACSSGSLDPSPVLLAMGVPEVIAHGAVRFSLSRETTAQEIDEAVEIVVRCVGRLRKSI